MTGHDAHIRRIFDCLDAGKPVSQRSLSGELGIALGLTNLLVRRMMRQGWVRLVRVPPNRYCYFLTPAGLAQKARMSRAYFAQSIHFYSEARARIQQTFETISTNWEQIAGTTPKHVVFFNAGEIAEIGYVCLQESDLRLRGVVDNERKRPFFGIPIHSVDALQCTELAGEPFGVLIVMSFGDAAASQVVLDARRVPSERIMWLT